MASEYVSTYRVTIKIEGVHCFGSSAEDVNVVFYVKAANVGLALERARETLKSELKWEGVLMSIEIEELRA